MFVWFIAWKGTPPSGSPRDLNGPDHFLVYTKPYYSLAAEPVTVDIIDDLPRSPGYQENKNFSWIELTRAQQMCQGDTAIVRSVDGYINEGPGFGICFVDHGDHVWTPRTDVLNSVTVEVVGEICKKEDIVFQRRDFRHHQFKECFLCSTSGGITPVKQIRGHAYTHQLTNRIKNIYDGLVSS